MSEAPGSASPALRTGLAAMVATLGLLPPFFTGAFVVGISRDFEFGTLELGYSVAVFYLACAVLVPPLGRVVDRIGATRSLRMGLAALSVSSLFMAVLANGPTRLVAALAMCGLANALVQPAANRLLVRSVEGNRLGVGFGVKQSAPPAASMVAGLMVPVFEGWQWQAAFVLLAVLAALTIVLLPRSQSSRRPVRRSVAPAPLPRGELVGFAFSLSLGSAASAGLTAFFVDMSVSQGLSPSRAGLWLGISSGLALATRVTLGYIMDRHNPAHFRLCGWMLLAGSAGIALMASLHPVAIWVGLPAALVGTWGYNGVFWYAVMQRYGTTPGGATGVIFPGGLIGAVAGPLLLGLIGNSSGYRNALLAATIIAIAGAAAMFWSNHRVHSSVRSA